MNTLEPPRQPTSPLPPDKKHQDELLDEALAESFPASDPPSSLHADEPLKRQQNPQDGSRRRDTDRSK